MPLQAIDLDVKNSFSWDQVGLEYDESVVIRVTGCPNGCARPYMAELGLVGDGPNSYQVCFEHKLM